MRAFLGLPLERDSRSEVRAWRDGNLFCDGRAVDPENFHITLCFLGSVSAADLDRICEQADALDAAPFDLVLDETGYFARPRVLWIGPSRPPPAIGELSRSLGRIAARAGLRIDRRPFRPHLTLMRKCRDPDLSAIPPPAIAFRCDRFCLYESRSTERGVRYLPLASWPLAAGPGGR